MNDPFRTIKNPIVTEKGMWQVDKYRRYTFKVNNDATKTEIKEAIEDIYGVKVQSVNTQIKKGKTKRVRFQYGHTPDWKKAIVKLKEGYSIDLI